MMSNDLILVTGASGFIATHIVKQLLEKGYRVRGTVRSLKDEKKVAPLRKLVANPRYPLELVEANLLDENCWANAVKDCNFVIHTASPFPNYVPNDEKEVIEPAVKGTLYVLNACVLPDSKVKRVVLTSSVAAIHSETEPNNSVFTEKNWPDINKQSPYYKSKTLAEKAAWDFVNERKNNNQPCFELAVINPGYVMGPLLHDSDCTSMLIIQKLLERQMPMVPSVAFPSCDVRDVALAHIKAMTLPEAVNNRHIIATTSKTNTFKEYADILDSEFKSKGYNVPTTTAPDCFIRFLGLFDKSVEMVKPALGKRFTFDNTRFKNILKIEPIPLKTTIIDMANSMIEKGKIKK